MYSVYSVKANGGVIEERVKGETRERGYLRIKILHALTRTSPLHCPPRQKASVAERFSVLLLFYLPLQLSAWRLNREQ